jgi:hypothetical protein
LSICKLIEFILIILAIDPRETEPTTARTTAQCLIRCATLTFQSNLVPSINSYRAVHPTSNRFSEGCTAFFFEKLSAPLCLEWSKIYRTVKRMPADGVLRRNRKPVFYIISSIDRFFFQNNEVFFGNSEASVAIRQGP